MVVATGHTIRSGIIAGATVGVSLPAGVSASDIAPGGDHHGVSATAHGAGVDIMLHTIRIMVMVVTTVAGAMVEAIITVSMMVIMPALTTMLGTAI